MYFYSSQFSFRIIDLQFLKVDSQIASCEMLIRTLTYSCCVRQSQCLENMYACANNFLGGFRNMNDYFLQIKAIMVTLSVRLT